MCSSSPHTGTMVPPMKYTIEGTQRSQNGGNSPQRPCYLLDLAPELQIAIAKELNYFDLKRLGSTCKHMKEVIQLSDFNTTLFRGAPLKVPKEGEHFILHPILDSIHDLIINDPKKAVLISCGAAYKVWICQDLVASTENAFSPALDKVRVMFKNVHDSFSPIIIKSSSKTKGVTIRDIIIAVAKAWNAETPGEVFPTITYFHKYSSHRQWRGWDDPRVDKVSGNLELSPLDTSIDNLYYDYDDYDDYFEYSEYDDWF